MKANDEQLKLEELINRIYYKNDQGLYLDEQPQNFTQILKIKNWAHIKQLRIYNCIDNFQKLKILTQLSWPNLTQLNLYTNNINSKGIKILIKTELPSLKYLYINNCKIGNEGLKNLSKSLWLNLQSLYIRNNKITNIHNQFISNNWIKIKLLELYQSKYFNGIQILLLQAMINISNFSQDIKNRQISEQINQIMGKKIKW